MVSRNYEVLLDLVKTANPITEADGVQLYPGIPIPVEGQSTLLPVVSKGAVNPFKGQVLFNYRRLELNKLFLGFTPSISAPAGRIKNTWGLIPYLNAKYGLELSTADIVNAPIDTRTLPTTLNVEANPTSLYYFGSFELEHTLGAIELSSLLPNIGALKYPAGVTELKHAPVFSFIYNADGFKETLSRLQVGEHTSANLATILFQISGVGWKYLDRPAPLNFYRAIVHYNGPVSEFVVPGENDFVLNKDFMNVLVFRLSSIYCTDATGLLTVYY